MLSPPSGGVLPRCTATLRRHFYGLLSHQFNCKKSYAYVDKEYSLALGQRHFFQHFRHCAYGDDESAGETDSARMGAMSRAGDTPCLNVINPHNYFPTEPLIGILSA
jgi:hypothetical protein